MIYGGSTFGSLTLGGDFNTLQLLSTKDVLFDATIKQVKMPTGIITNLNNVIVLQQTSVLPQNN